MAEKLDVYSDHRVPFDVAAYCRGHKFSPQAWELAKGLRKVESIREMQASLEHQLSVVEEAVAVRVKAVRAKMEKEENGV